MLHHGYSYTEHAVAKIAADLNIFSVLIEAEAPMNTDSLATKVGCDPALLDP